MTLLADGILQFGTKYNGLTIFVGTVKLRMEYKATCPDCGDQTIYRDEIQIWAFREYTNTTELHLIPGISHDCRKLRGAKWSIMHISNNLIINHPRESLIEWKW